MISTPPKNMVSCFLYLDSFESVTLLTWRQLLHSHEFHTNHAAIKHFLCVYNKNNFQAFCINSLYTQSHLHIRKCKDWDPMWEYIWNNKYIKYLRWKSRTGTFTMISILSIKSSSLAWRSKAEHRMTVSQYYNFYLTLPEREIMVVCIFVSKYNVMKTFRYAWLPCPVRRTLRL